MIIIERDENYGCTRNIREGILEITEKYGRVIVIEDDIIVNKSFLIYMNEALNYYNEKKEVFSIGGYNPTGITKEFELDTFIYPRFSCWGWATWRDRLENVDWEKRPENIEKISKRTLRKYAPDMMNCYEVDKRGLKCFDSTWDVAVMYTVFENGKKCVVPSISHSNNIGFDGSGERCTIADQKVNLSFNQDLSRDSYKFGNEELPDRYLDQYIANVTYRPFSIKVKQGITRFVLVVFGTLHCEKMLEIYFKITKKINGKR